ncbi:MAG: hypothetical protein AAFO17_00600 [Pseudomonadota bacterium]
MTNTELIRNDDELTVALARRSFGFIATAATVLLATTAIAETLHCEATDGSGDTFIRQAESAIHTTFMTDGERQEEVFSRGASNPWADEEECWHVFGDPEGVHGASVIEINQSRSLLIHAYSMFADNRFMTTGIDQTSVNCTLR